MENISKSRSLAASKSCGCQFHGDHAAEPEGGEIELNFTDDPRSLTGDPEISSSDHLLLANLFCNGAGGVYRVEDDSRIDLKILVSELIACGEKEDQTARAFTEQLRRIDRYELEGDMLTLYDDDEPGSKLIFERKADRSNK